MRPLGLTGHLGDNVAALVDGQLPAAQLERAWSHVHVCPGCRRAVAAEYDVKQALGGLRDHDADSPGLPTPPTSWLSPEALAAWEQVSEVERDSRRRTALAVGGGALTVSMAVAVAVGSTGALAPPQVRAVPGEVRAGVYAATGTARATTSRPATRADAVVPASSVGSWTGTPTGAETARVVRSDRSR